MSSNLGRVSWRDERNGDRCRKRDNWSGRDRRNRSQKQNLEFKKNRNFDDRGKQDTAVPIKYEPGKTGKEKTKHRFTIYGEDETTTVSTQEYTGGSLEELFSSIKEVWDVIDEYELLPTKTNDEGLVIAPARTRHPSEAIIGIIELTLPSRGRLETMKNSVGRDTGTSTEELRLGWQSMS